MFLVALFITLNGFMLEFPHSSSFRSLSQDSDQMPEGIRRLPSVYRALATIIPLKSCCCAGTLRCFQMQGNDITSHCWISRNAKLQSAWSSTYQGFELYSYTATQVEGNSVWHTMWRSSTTSALLSCHASYTSNHAATLCGSIFSVPQLCYTLSFQQRQTLYCLLLPF